MGGEATRIIGATSRTNRVGAVALVRRGARRVAGFAFGVSFGVLARTAGMGRIAPIVMSATTFAGSAQFAVASILRDGGTAAAAIVAAAMLNARYIPIGISVASSFEGSAPRRFLHAQMVVDESWAVALKRRGGFDLRVLLDKILHQRQGRFPHGWSPMFDLEIGAGRYRYRPYERLRVRIVF